MRRTALRRMRIAYALRRMRCVSLRRCVVLRFVSLVRFVLYCVAYCVALRIAYCVEGVSRIALRFVEALRVAFHFVLR